MILLDLTHTSHSRARTGIQRVCRAIRTELGKRKLGRDITWDKYGREWRPLETWERDNLDTEQAGAKRGATWPSSARWRGRFRRWWGRRGETDVGLVASLAGNPAAGNAHRTRETKIEASLLVPELFGAETAAALPALRAGVKGPSVAVFHDAIALQFPELSPPKTVARFPYYLRELALFDGIAAVSQDSRDVLLDYWRWLGLRDTPPVVAIPLGIERMEALSRMPATQNETEGAPVRVLCVGTIEARKNHLALLEAAETLWRAGVRFELRLIGMAQADTGGPAMAMIERLRAAGRTLRYDGPVGEGTLMEAYESCDFTVYPSLYEGFGLPVLESLSAGKPCVCSGRGALGESAAEGGCLALENVKAATLAEALRRLVENAAEREALAEAARRRTFRTWATYADELIGWCGGLRKRDARR